MDRLVGSCLAKRRQSTPASNACKPQGHPLLYANNNRLKRPRSSRGFLALAVEKLTHLRMSDIFILVGIMGGFALLAQSLLVILHELGHAGPALLFTRANVAIYLGSYGDSTNTWRLRVGLLTIYAKRSLFWNKGLCVLDNGKLSRPEQYMVILGGVLISLLIAMLSFYGALAIDLHGSVKLFLFLLTLFAVVSLVTNLVPSQRGGLPNDGLLLKLLLADSKQTATFSPELKALIARSRDVAIDLGYEYVSTLHVLLADCAMPYPYSLVHLLFATSEEYSAFYEGCRLGPAAAGVGSLPLTAELEQALKEIAIAHHYGFCRELYPCHLLVAASQVTDSTFRQVAQDAATLLPQLLTYYHTFDELMAD
jgi:hypothetical protein